MRPALLIAVLCLTACTEKKKNLPPPDRFYFPSGIHHAQNPAGGEGFLYVISANFDRRYDDGLLTAVDLDRVGLPAFPGRVDGGAPALLLDLMVDAGSTIELANFGADPGVESRPGGVTRLYIPSRAEGQKLMVVDALGPQLTCVPMMTSDGGTFTAEDPRDCGGFGASLVAEEHSTNGAPRADSPMSAAVSADGGHIWVSSGRQADSPRFSMTNFNDYVVRIDAQRLVVDIPNFIGIGPGSTHAVVAGKRWMYFSGRFPSAVVNPPLVRLVRCEPNCEVIFPNLENDVKIGEARGLALSSDETRLFLAGRQASGVTGSDVLVIATITNAESTSPALSLVRTVPLPTEPQMVRTISRGPGRGDLVAVTCSGAGSLVIYDDERGDLVAQLDGIGLQPSSFTVDRRTGPGVNGARIYVTNFTDGRVAVVDLPDLDVPQDARIIAHLGASQVCLTRSLQCDGGT